MDQELFNESAGDIRVERNATLAAEPEAIWEHLTDGELVGEWMEGEVQMDPRPGGAITLTPEQGPPVWGTVEEVIPGRRLQWSWRTDDGLPTQVEIDLESTEEGTAITVRETLLPWKVTGLPPQWVDPPYPKALLAAAA